MVSLPAGPAAQLLLLLSSVLPGAWSAPSFSDTRGAPKLGAVACESDICSKVGTWLLESGGNAADALVGTVICVGLTAMYHSGIGGGGFLLLRSSKGEYEYVDFRETA